MKHRQISLTHDDVLATLGRYVQSVCGDVAIVSGQQNRVALPRPPVVVMTIIRAGRLAWNQHSYTDSALRIKQSSELRVQLDFYGSEVKPALDMAQIFATTFFDGYAWEKFCSYELDIHPLYCSEPRNAPFVDQSKQYADRWMLEAHIHYTPVVTTPQQSALELEVKTHHV